MAAQKKIDGLSPAAEKLLSKLRSIWRTSLDVEDLPYNVNISVRASGDLIPLASIRKHRAELFVLLRKLRPEATSISAEALASCVRLPRTGIFLETGDVDLAALTLRAHFEDLKKRRLAPSIPVKSMERVR